MKTSRLSRRTLLRGAGGILVALPALEAMRSASVRAQSVTAPKRLVVFYTPNGTNAWNQSDTALAHNDQTDFWPAQTGANFVLGKEVAPLEPLRDHLLIVSGVNGESMKKDDSAENPAIANHGDLHSIGMSQMLTGVSYLFDQSTGVIPGALPGGYAGGISVDQYIAQKLGSRTAFPTLEFGVDNTTDHGVLPFSRMISAGANQPIPAEQDPAAMFKRMFSSSTPVAMGTVDHSLAQRKSILDHVQSDFTRLESKVGAADKQKLDAHVTAIRDLETRLGKQQSAGPISPVSCDSTQAGQSVASEGDAANLANFPATGKLHMDLLTLALKCDLTRIASLQWSWARSTLVHTWAGSTQSHHDMTHAGQSAELTRLNTWYAQQLAYLGTALKAATDVDGKTVLDNTLIYWCSDVAWAYVHSFDCMRAFFLGSCGGAVKTGQHIDAGGVAHQKLLVTLMNAMGVMENQFGNPAFGSGALPGMLA